MDNCVGALLTDNIVDTESEREAICAALRSARSVTSVSSVRRKLRPPEGNVETKNKGGGSAVDCGSTIATRRDLQL
eukprot:COSAG06_NODE_52709_length_304_cov_0.756098_1_plen_75_part_01